MSATNGKVNLQAMKQMAPPVNPAEAIRKAAALGLSGAMREADVGAVYEKLKQMALAGDKKAMEMFFKLTLGNGKEADARSNPGATDAGGMKALAQSIQDLVDEIRITKAEAAMRENDPLLKHSARRIAQMPNHEDEDDE
jgi:hypothetical protein